MPKRKPQIQESLPHKKTAKEFYTMKQTTIHYKIDQDGNVKESVQGIKGKDCQAVTKPIEESLGNVVAQTHTADYFTSEENWRAGYDVMTEGALGDYPDD